MLQRILDENGWGQFKVEPMLSVGGHWRITPLIWAVLNEVEGWEQARVNLPGTIMLQISYNEHFSILSMGIVLQYNLPSGRTGEDRPEAPQRRYTPLGERFGGLRQGAHADLPAIKNWNYVSPSGTKETLWSKPVFSYSYQVNSLPEDPVLKADLKSLSESLLTARREKI